MGKISKMPDPHPHAHSSLAQLEAALAGKGFGTELTRSGLTVVAPVDHGPRLSDKITCAPRPSDGDRPWFWTSWGEPIAEADHITDAVVAIAGNLKPRR